LLLLYARDSQRQRHRTDVESHPVGAERAGNYHSVVAVGVSVTDPLPSDHPVVDSHRIELDAVGSTGRPQLVLPSALSCAIGDTVWLSLAGTGAYAEVAGTLHGDAAIRAAYANRQLARTAEGGDLLGDWFEEHGFGPGTTLLLDVLTEGYGYGLREPGTRVVYEPVERPDPSLADIAESLGE